MFSSPELMELAFYKCGTEIVQKKWKTELWNPNSKLTAWMKDDRKNMEVCFKI